MGNQMLSLLTISWVIVLIDARCNMLRKGGLSCAEKQNIVYMHNTLRQQVALGQIRGQPSASNMLEMTWDEELARKAQNWANQCPHDHDSSYSRNVPRFSVGQNIATTWSSPRPNAYGEQPNFSSEIKAWFNEVYRHSFGTGYSSSTGHYSQMVWSDSFLVGCGYSYYNDGNRYVKKYICDYGPGGNVIGSKPYKPGSPSCKLYGSVPSIKFSGLCKVPKYYNYPCYNYGKK